MSELSVEERLEKLEQRLNGILQLREAGALDQHYHAHSHVYGDVGKLKDEAAWLRKRIKGLEEELVVLRTVVVKLSSRPEVHPLIWGREARWKAPASDQISTL